MNVTDENDLMIINKSGITIRMNVSDLSVIGRATQGVRLINLEKRNDEIASVCKVMSDTEEETAIEKGEKASGETVAEPYSDAVSDDTVSDQQPDVESEDNQEV